MLSNHDFIIRNVESCNYFVTVFIQDNLKFNTIIKDIFNYRYWENRKIRFSYEFNVLIILKCINEDMTNKQILITKITYF